MARWERPTTARRFSRVATLGPSPFSLVRTLPLTGPLHPYDYRFVRQSCGDRREKIAKGDMCR